MLENYDNYQPDISPLQMVTYYSFGNRKECLNLAGRSVKLITQFHVAPRFRTRNTLLHPCLAGCMQTRHSFERTAMKDIPNLQVVSCTRYSCLSEFVVCKNSHVLSCHRPCLSHSLQQLVSHFPGFISAGILLDSVSEVRAQNFFPLLSLPSRLNALRIKYVPPGELVMELVWGNRKKPPWRGYCGRWGTVERKK
jgi:hypothetical protein